MKVTVREQKECSRQIVLSDCKEGDVLELASGSHAIVIQAPPEFGPGIVTSRLGIIWLGDSSIETGSRCECAAIGAKKGEGYHRITRILGNLTELIVEPRS